MVSDDGGDDSDRRITALGVALVNACCHGCTATKNYGCLYVRNNHVAHREGVQSDWQRVVRQAAAEVAQQRELPLAVSGRQQPHDMHWGLTSVRYLYSPIRKTNPQDPRLVKLGSLLDTLRCLMSTYYRPPRQHATTSESTQASPQQSEAHPLDIPDHSIYIFPTPSSLPPSPGGSSVFSVPSDFTDLSIITETRSRNHSLSSYASSPLSPVGRRRRPSSATRRHSYAHRSPSPNLSVISDPEVELWDWAAESGEDIPDEDAYWEFEAEVERTSRWGIVTRHRAASRSPSSLPATNDFIDQHYRAYLRSRTQSNISSLTTHAVRTTRSANYTPQPRIHIPLLSFFASLLFLDLDDPALRLLSQSSPDSVLFPGQGDMLDSPDDDYRAGGADTRGYAVPSLAESADVSKPHGLFRLLTEGSLHPVRVLREGLSVVCDPCLPLPSAFPLSGFSAIKGIGRLVGGIWSTGSRAWHEVTLSSE